MRRPPRGRWVPPFIVGACLASAGELAVGLLVYAGPGFLRSVTTVLAVESAALGVGLWNAPGPSLDLSDVMRRRWLTCLLSFLVATLFAAAWSIVGELAGSALGQGVGLAALAGLPLYAGGALLGGLSSMEVRGERVGPATVGAHAAFGAVLGLLITGAALTRVLTPSSLMLACIILLSAAGLIFSHVQDGVMRIQVKGRRPSLVGEVRVEERSLPAAGPPVRALLEGSALRRWTVAGGQGVAPWEVEIFRALMPDPGTPYRVLHVGGGASPLSRNGIREHPLATFDVTERSPATVELARELLDASADPWDGGRVSLAIGNLEDLVELHGVYDMVCIDLASLSPVGGPTGLSSRTRAALVGRVAAGGTLVFGPLPLGVHAWPLPGSWCVQEFRRVSELPLAEMFGSLAAEEVVTIVRSSTGPEFRPPPGFEEQESAG
jgi:hypothetical protein